MEDHETDKVFQDAELYLSIEEQRENEEKRQAEGLEIARSIGIIYSIFCKRIQDKELELSDTILSEDTKQAYYECYLIHLTIIKIEYMKDIEYWYEEQSKD